MVEEGDHAYNAATISALEKELLGPVERGRLHKAPAWVRYVITDLIRRIANLRAARTQDQQEVERLRAVYEAAERWARAEDDSHEADKASDNLRIALTRAEGEG